MRLQDALRKLTFEYRRRVLCPNGHNCPFPPQGVDSHHAMHEPGGVDEVNDIDIGNTGVLLSAHEARHVDGGLDEIVSALDSRAIALTTQGDIVYRNAAALARLPAGVAGQALLTGGAGANPSWGAPAPAGHSTSHEPGGADEVNDIDIGNTGVLLSAHETRHRPGGADALPVGTPSNIATANAEGTSTSFARLDHEHNHPSGLGFALHHDHYARRYPNLACYGSNDADMTVATARVYLTPVEVRFLSTVDQLEWRHAGTIAGNARVGIYEDNGETPAGGSLVVESASIAKPGTDLWAGYSISNTQLTPGLYWMVFQSDEATSRLRQESGFGGAAAINAYYYDRAGGYGALTDPCPAVTVIFSCPYGRLRVASVP